MRFDLFSLFVLLLSTIVVASLQTALALGMMYLLHRQFADKLEEKNYLDFDFDNFQRGPFQELITRLALIFLAPTLVLHIVEYLILGLSIRRHPLQVCLVLFVLETGAIAAGFVYLLKLDQVRATILTVFSALIYLFLLWIFLYNQISS